MYKSSVFFVIIYISSLISKLLLHCSYHIHLLCDVCFCFCFFCFCFFFVCLFVRFQLHEQFFSNLATVTITDDREANLDFCLALTAFRSEGSLTCHTCCDTGPPFLRSYSILTPECRAVGDGAITTYFKRLRFDAAGTSGAQTHDFLDAKREYYHLATTTGYYVMKMCYYMKY
jgi:hypothetical protein